MISKSPATITLSAIIVAAFISVGSLTADPLQGQAVTFADFNHITDIASSLSNVYFATAGGIIRYNKLEEKWDEPLTGTFGIDHDDIQRIWVDNFDHTLFAETSQGLFEYDFLFGSWLPINEIPRLNNPAQHIKPPEIMYAPPGFNYAGNGRLIDFWGRYFVFNDIIDDNSGQIWIGTWGYGALKAGSASNYLELLPFGLIQDRVNAIYYDNGALWVSGAVFDDYRTGITRFDPDNNEFSYIESGINRDFPLVDVNCLTGDEFSLYIGTTVGLLIHDRELGQITHRIGSLGRLPDENVLSLLAVDSRIYVGTAAGLGMLEVEADSVYEVRPAQFAGEIIYDLEQVDSSVWIASSVGAYRLKLSSGKLQRFRDPDQVLFGDVYDIERYDKYLWFLSGDGLVQLNIETGDSQPYRDVTRRMTPTALAVNDTIAAVASDKGVTILFHANPKPFTRDFTTDDGLASNYVYSLLLDGDYLWIGSDRGLTRFLWNNPRRID